MGIAMGIRQSVTGWGALAFLALVPAGIVTPTSDSSVPTAVESLAYLTPDTGNYQVCSSADTEKPVAAVLHRLQTPYANSGLVHRFFMGHSSGIWV